MKRAIFPVLALAVAAAAGLSARAQTANPTIDQLIEKHIAAIGGRAAMEKITSRVATGTIELADMGLSGTIEVSEKAPDKSLVVVNLDAGGQALEIREGASSEGAWDVQPGMGVRDKTGTELAEAKRGAAFNAELKIKQLYKSLELKGREKIGAREAFVVMATPAEGAPARMYIDAETFLLLRVSSSRDTPQGAMDVDVYLEDYRATNGVKQPWLIRQVTPQGTFVIKINSLKNNVALDDAIFKRPAGF
jgi:hypothetical protein